MRKYLQEKIKGLKSTFPIILSFHNRAITWNFPPFFSLPSSICLTSWQPSQSNLGWSCLMDDLCPKPFNFASPSPQWPLLEWNSWPNSKRGISRVSFGLCKLRQEDDIWKHMKEDDWSGILSLQNFELLGNDKKQAIFHKNIAIVTRRVQWNKNFHKSSFTVPLSHT